MGDFRFRAFTEYLGLLLGVIAIIFFTVNYFELGQNQKPQTTKEFNEDNSVYASYATQSGGDAFVSDDEKKILKTKGTRALASLERTDYMAGKVAVNIIVIQCRGRVGTLFFCERTWNNSRLQKVKKEISAGLNWWKKRFPKSELDFVLTSGKNYSPLNLSVSKINVTTTPFEPISQSYRFQYEWINKAMNQMGVSGNNYFTRVRNFNKKQTVKYEADQAFTIFVVDSIGTNGRFADGYFAYAYFHGPFIVMTYSNDGYGIDNMDAVLAHEMGHIFGALDQYSSAGQPCELSEGYFKIVKNIELQNSIRNIDSDVLGPGCRKRRQPGIMKGQIAPYFKKQVSVSSAAQLGYVDLVSYVNGHWVNKPDGVIDSAGGYSLNLLRSKQQIAKPYQFDINIKNIPLPLIIYSLQFHMNVIKKVTAYDVVNKRYLKVKASDGKFNEIEEKANVQGLNRKSFNVDICITGKIGGRYCQTIYMPNPHLIIAPPKIR